MVENHDEREGDDGRAEQRAQTEMFGLWMNEMSDELARMSQVVEQLQQTTARLAELHAISLNTALTTSSRTENVAALVTEILKSLNGPPTPPLDRTDDRSDGSDRVVYIPISLAGFPPLRES